MSNPQAEPLPSPLPFAEHVNRVGIEQPFRWLALGWRDFLAAMPQSLAHGALFVVAGFVLTVGLAWLGLTYLIAPLMVGFLLVAPGLTVGFYAISRRLAQGDRPGFCLALAAWRDNPAPLFALGLMQVMFLVVWMRFAALIFALSFPESMLSVQDMLDATLFTPSGLTFLATGTVVGAGLATIAFAFGAFSLPMLLDRRAGVLQAVVTSAVAVALNPRPMAVWAALVVLFTAAGLALGYIGLVVTLPLIGHASWHAYRDTIR